MIEIGLNISIIRMNANGLNWLLTTDGLIGEKCKYMQFTRSTSNYMQKFKVK